MAYDFETTQKDGYILITASGHIESLEDFTRIIRLMLESTSRFYFRRFLVDERSVVKTVDPYDITLFADSVMSSPERMRVAICTPRKTYPGSVGWRRSSRTAPWPTGSSPPLTRPSNGSCPLSSESIEEALPSDRRRPFAPPGSWTTKRISALLPKSFLSCWSGRRDLNPRHPVPKTGALPGCATPRQICEDSLWLRCCGEFRPLRIKIRGGPELPLRLARGNPRKSDKAPGLLRIGRGYAAVLNFLAPCQRKSSQI